MARPLVFVSCGQRTPEEKALGEAICEIIRSKLAAEVFYAEKQHSLAGLHQNILEALGKASAFVTVLHDRGEMPFNTLLRRASVWIEQEIAIAAFIQLTTKKSLPMIAYIEAGVGREGLRELLHLNPIEFRNNDEILADLPSRILEWHISPALTQISLVTTRGRKGRDNYWLSVRVKNNGPRTANYRVSVELPEKLFFPTDDVVSGEEPTDRVGYRKFVLDESSAGAKPFARSSTRDFFDIELLASEMNRHTIYYAAELGDEDVKAKMNTVQILIRECLT